MLFCMFQDFIKRHKGIIASNGVFLHVAKVDVCGYEDFERVIIIPARKAEHEYSGTGSAL